MNKQILETKDEDLDTLIKRYNLKIREENKKILKNRKGIKITRGSTGRKWIPNMDKESALNNIYETRAYKRDKGSSEAKLNLPPCLAGTCVKITPMDKRIRNEATKKTYIVKGYKRRDTGRIEAKIHLPYKLGGIKVKLEEIKQ